MGLFNLFIGIGLTLFFVIVSVIITRLIFYISKRVALLPSVILLFSAFILFINRSPSAIDVDLYWLFSVALFISSILNGLTWGLLLKNKNLAS